MLQEALILLFFLGATFYVGRLIVRNLKAKESCASGCGKCSVVEMAKPETISQA